MTLKPIRLISLSETCDRVGLSRWAIRKRVLEGTFPKPVAVGYRATKFVEKEIEDWLTSLLARRDATES